MSEDIFDTFANVNNTYDTYQDIWAVIDFLLSGNEEYIKPLLNGMINRAHSEQDKLNISAKIETLVLPYQYAYEVRKLTSKVANTLNFSGIPKQIDTNFTETNVELNTYLKQSIESLINYGGAVTAFVPANGKVIVKHIAGKYIVDVCKTQMGEIEYLKWFTYEKVFDSGSRTTTNVKVTYEYFIENKNVVLVYTRLDKTYTLPVKITLGKLPICGINLPNNDESVFRGTPYLTSLAVNLMRYILNSTSLDHLLDTVMQPRLVHKGSTPIKKLSSKTWRGVFIAPNDSLTYLEHSGNSLKAALEQLKRYKDEIEEICSFNSPEQKQKTAYEIAQIEASNETLKYYIIDRVLKYFGDIFEIYKEIKPTLGRAKIAYEPISLSIEEETQKSKKEVNETV